MLKRLNTDTFKSWEFISLVVSNVALWLATTGSTIHSSYAYVFTAVSAGAYALARAAAKANTDGKPFAFTTEFYVVIIGAISAVWAGFQGHISGTVFTEVTAFLVSAAAIANGIRKPPATQVDPNAAVVPRATTTTR